MKLPPLGYVLESIASQKLTWKLALAEWIDNSLDAQATSIAILLDPKKFISVSDNGNGCANPLTMIQLGGRIAMKSTQLGRYGIGGKDSALWVGGVDSFYIIRTIHRRQVTMLLVDWRKFGDSDWDIEPPVPEPAAIGESGTKITVRPIRPLFPAGKWLDILLSDLGYIYSPALKMGAQITFQLGKTAPVPLKRWLLPGLLEVEKVDTEIEVQGKRVRIYCGIVKEGQANPRPGLSYLYGYRVIIPSSQLGCGERNIVNICGFVELSNDWRLTKNKDAIVDGEALFEAVYDAIDPVLKRAEELGSLCSSQAFETELTEKFRGFFLGGQPHDLEKERRDQGTRMGTILPRNTKRTRRPNKTQMGDKFSPRNAASIRLLIKELGGSKIGYMNYPNVILNRDNEWIKEMEKAQNSDALVAQAATLVNAGRFFESGLQLKLKLDCISVANAEDFAESLGEIMNGMNRPERAITKS